MEIRHLPIPVPHYPVLYTEGAGHALPGNPSSQQPATVAPRSQYQQRTHSANLHNPQLRHSAQQAINTYQAVDHQDETNRNGSAEILNRIDALA